MYSRKGLQDAATVMRFAIIASPRTGSSHLTNLLHNQEDIICNGEICHPKKVFVRWDKADRTDAVLADLAELRAKNPREFLERIFSQNYGRRHVGFKILMGQKKAILREVVLDGSIAKIVLFRRNVLANYSSRLIAMETGKYALKDRGYNNSVPAKPVSFDPVDFVNFTRKYLDFYERTILKIQESGQTYHLINYEEINSSVFFESLLSFIGSVGSDRHANNRHIKQNPANIVSRFSNPEVVQSFLDQHHLQHWMFEGAVSFYPFDSGGVPDEPGDFDSVSCPSAESA